MDQHNKKQRVLTDDDAEAIADKVVEKAKNGLLIEFAKVVWAAIQKAFITAVIAVLAWSQLKGH